VVILKEQDFDYKSEEGDWVLTSSYDGVTGKVEGRFQSKRDAKKFYKYLIKSGLGSRNKGYKIVYDPQKVLGFYNPVGSVPIQAIEGDNLEQAKNRYYFENK